MPEVTDIGERRHTPVNLLPERGEKTRAAVRPHRDVVTTDDQAGWEIHAAIAPC